jgi:hypothetical protein
MKQLRGPKPKHENRKLARVRPVRCPAWGIYDIGSGKNGHLARANGAIDGPYCSPAWSSVCRRRCEPLAGRGGGFGFGGGAAPAPTRPHAARGALLQFEWLRKRAVPRPSGAAPEGLAGMAELRRLFPGGQEEQSNGFATIHKPCQICKKKALVVHVTRW